VCFGFLGGDRLKFKNVIIATVSAALIEWLVYGVLALVLVPVNAYWGFETAALVSILFAGVVVGYVFSGKMQEESSRMKSIGKIVLVSSLDHLPQHDNVRLCWTLQYFC